jgi:hypothetical protein
MQVQLQILKWNSWNVWQKYKNTYSMANGERKIRTAVTLVRFVPKLKTVGKIYYSCLF